MGRTLRIRTRRKRSQSSDSAFELRKLVQPVIISVSRSLHSREWRNEAALNVGEFPLTGRGVYSNKTIPENGLIISLPVEAMISIVTIENDSIFSELLDETLAEACAKVSSQSLLSLYLLHLKHLERETEYIATIPDEFSVPYFCRKSLLSNTIPSVKSRVLKQKRMIDEDFCAIKTSFGSRRCSCCDQRYFDDIIRKSDFEWSFFAVNSRSVYFGKEISEKMRCENKTIQLLCDEPNLALAPYLDLLNHNHIAKSIIKFSCDGNELRYQIYSGNAVEKFSQVFINYGALDNVKLLTDYGFFLPDNPHDAVEIDSKALEDELEEVPYKMRMFVERHKLNENLFVSRESGIGHQLHRLAFTIGQAASTSIEFDENQLKKIIYGDLDSVMETSAGKELFLRKVIGASVAEAEDSIRCCDEDHDEGEIIYKQFLLDRRQWLTEVIQNLR